MHMTKGSKCFLQCAQVGWHVAKAVQQDRVRKVAGRRISGSAKRERSRHPILARENLSARNSGMSGLCIRLPHVGQGLLHYQRMQAQHSMSRQASRPPNSLRSTSVGRAHILSKSRHVPRPVRPPANLWQRLGRALQLARRHRTRQLPGPSLSQARPIRLLLLGAWSNSALDRLPACSYFVLMSIEKLGGGLSAQQARPRARPLHCVRSYIENPLRSSRAGIRRSWIRRRSCGQRAAIFRWASSGPAGCVRHVEAEI